MFKQSPGLAHGLAAVAIGLALTPAFFGSAFSARGYSDSDWNTSFFENCALPAHSKSEPPPVSQIDRNGDLKLAVRLKPGDIGGCSSDRIARASAPYWERAELRQTTNLKRGQVYQISFSAEFVDGFIGHRETFFQVHSWSKQCSAAPLTQLQFSWSKLRVKTLHGDTPRERGSLRTLATPPVLIEDLLGTERQFKLHLDLTETASISIFMDETPLVLRAPLHLQYCAEPHIKLGLYRPGKENPGRSMILFDDIRIEPMGETTIAKK
jgi:hypothetical protein